jgi:hypothetical protein
MAQNLFYTSYDGFYAYPNTKIISNEQIEKLLEKTFDNGIKYFPSPDRKAMVIIGSKQSNRKDNSSDRWAYLTDMELSYIKRLEADYFYNWSPDSNTILLGKRTADQSISGTYAVNKDGTGLRKLTNGGFYETRPFWFPNSHDLYYSRFQMVFAITDDGRNYRRINMENFPEIENTSLLYGLQESPNGDKLAVLLSYFGDVNQRHKLILYITDKDLSDPTAQIIIDPRDDRCSIHGGLYWIDESHILIASENGKCIFTIDIDSEEYTSNTKILKMYEQNQQEIIGSVIFCGLTPDKRNIAYLDGFNNRNLFIMDLKGLGPSLLILDNYLSLCPN